MKTRTLLYAGNQYQSSTGQAKNTVFEHRVPSQLNACAHDCSYFTEGQNQKLS